MVFWKAKINKSLNPNMLQIQQRKELNFIQNYEQQIRLMRDAYRNEEYRLKYSF